MRTIKFRGKCAKGSRYAGEWAYGSCVQCEKSDDVLITAAINDRCSCTYHVDPATVGQFTGLTDKNGKEIYEGDIIKEDNLIHKILWINEASAFCRCNLKYMDIRYRISRDAMSYIEVIGNIHDNPELIEKGGEA